MVPTMPRLRASSASSRGVQWLIGRPDAWGLTGQGDDLAPLLGAEGGRSPGRGASWRRSGTAQPGRVSQWRRQRRTVVRVVPRRRATSGAVRPPPIGGSPGLEAQVLGRLRGHGSSWSGLTLFLESGTAGGLGPGIVVSSTLQAVV